MLLKKDRSGGDSIPEAEKTPLPMDAREEIPLAVRAMMTATNRFCGSF
ncbi:MAG: hypothetical protein J6A16_10615 [Oscillospiraceae bacterium]|nr:hypothetical protein [Oscillospiraceae bacterium]